MLYKTTEEKNYCFVSETKTYLLIQDKQSISGIILNSPSTPNPKVFIPHPHLPSYLSWMSKYKNFIKCNQTKLKEALGVIQNPENNTETIEIEKKCLTISSYRKCGKKHKYSPIVPVYNPQEIKINLKFNANILLRPIDSIKAKDWNKSCISFIELDGKHTGISIISPKLCFGLIAYK